MHNITNTELKIIDLLIKDENLKKISNKLNISYETVR